MKFFFFWLSVCFLVSVIFWVSESLEQLIWLKPRNFYKKILVTGTEPWVNGGGEGGWGCKESNSAHTHTHWPGWQKQNLVASVQRRWFCLRSLCFYRSVLTQNSRPHAVIMLQKYKQDAWWKLFSLMTFLWCRWTAGSTLQPWLRVKACMNNTISV